MSSNWSDSLYLSRDELPDSGELHMFGGLECSVALVDTEPDALAAMWMPDRVLALSVVDATTPAELAAALPLFAAYAHGAASGLSHAQITLPSRDIDRSTVARQHGFLPSTVLAVRDHRSRPDPGPAPEQFAIRPATEADAERVFEVWWEQTEYGSRLGSLRATPETRAALRRSVPDAITGDNLCLVAEEAGGVVGLVVANPPGASGWVAARIDAAPVSYLALASTTAHARGRGVAGAIVAAVHRWQRAQGVAVSALHYAVDNPLSVPFWSQQAYRPLLTAFIRPVG